MIRRAGRWSLLAAGAALIAAPAAADEELDPFELSPEQLFGAEVISASRTSESIWEAPAAIYVVTSADIERSGATTIAETLRLVPGVQVARINTSGWAVSVRGFNSALANKLLVLVDGRETYDPLFSGVYWDVQDTALEDIDRIEVIRGPGATLWGANAVNGVINIITRRAEETQGALLSASAGDVERAVVTARYGGRLGDNVHWRIYGRAFDRAAQESLAGGSDHSAWEAWRSGLRADIALDARNELTVQGEIYHSETGQMRLVGALAPPYASLQNEEIVAEGGHLMGRWTHETSDDGRLVAQAYFDLTRRNQALLEDRRTTFDLDVQYEFPTIGARHDLIAGIRYRNSADRVTETELITSPHRTHETQLLSAFAQDEIRLSEAWRLTVGSKFDDNDYSGFEIQPSARLQWMGADQTVWASVSRAVRSPSELEREFNIILAAGEIFGTLATIEILPSPGFDSESLTAYELGYRRQWNEALAMDVALFRNEYEDLATLSTLAPFVASDPTRIVLAPILTTNSSSAETQGGEIVFEWAARDNLNLSLAWSVLDLDVDGPPAPLAIDSEIAEGQSPNSQATLRAEWDASERWSLDGALYYVDELPAFQVERYIRADVRVGYQLTANASVELIGQNLFDNQHREFTNPSEANAAEITRSVFGRLTWRH